MTDFLDRFMVDLDQTLHAEHRADCLCDACYRKRWEESFTRADVQDLAAAHAAHDRTLDVLQALVAALPERFEYEFSHDSLRVVNALREAHARLAECTRRGR